MCLSALCETASLTVLGVRRRCRRPRDPDAALHGPRATGHGREHAGTEALPPLSSTSFCCLCPRELCGRKACHRPNLHSARPRETAMEGGGKRSSLPSPGAGWEKRPRRHRRELVDARCSPWYGRLCGVTLHPTKTCAVSLPVTSCRTAVGGQGFPGHRAGLSLPFWPWVREDSNAH